MRALEARWFSDVPGRDYRRHQWDEIRHSRIGILVGNRSIENRLFIEQAPDTERGIVSIERCLRALSVGYTLIDTTDDGFIERLKGCDLIFVYMHGEYGEDGRIQGLLDYLGKPYTGSGVLPNALGLNKVAFKRFIRSLGILTPDFCEWYGNRETNLVRVARSCRPPFMVKPTCGGSSIGIVRHDTLESVANHLSASDLLYESYFIEDYIAGKMVTSAVLDVDGETWSLPLLEIATDHAFYDQNAKLNRDASATTFVIPAGVSTATAAAIEATSREIYARLGCRGFARFDYVVDDQERVYCLEVNTIPGLAENSNFTRACRHAGIEYPDMLLAILRTAMRTSGMAGGHASAPDRASERLADDA